MSAGEPAIAAAPEAPARAASVTGAAMAGLVAAGLSVAVSVARSKVTALMLGPEGLGRASEVMQLVTTVFVPLGLVSGPPLLSALSRASAADGTATAKQQEAADGAATLLWGGGLVLLAVAVGTSLVLFPEWRLQAALYAGLAAFGTVVGSATSVPTQLLLARGQNGVHARYSTLVALLSGVAMVAGTAALALDGQFLALALAPVLAFLVGLPFYRRAVPGLRWIPKPRFDASFLKEALAVGGTNLIAGFTLQGALSTIRWSLDHHGGAAANGQFQASWAIGATYFGVFLNGVGNAVFPRYAAAKDTAQLSAEVDEALRFILRAAPPVILAAIAVREPAIHLLYSDKFDEAAGMAGIQMAGDLAKAVSFAFAGPLLYRGVVRGYLVTEVAAAVLFASLSLVLIPRLGVAGVAWAYAGMYATYAVLTAFVLRQACGVAIRGRALALALAFTVVALVAVEGTHKWPWLRVGLLAMSALWAWRAGLVRPLAARVMRKLGRAVPARAE